MRESREMYLETIYVLTQKLDCVHAIDVCQHMGFSKPSVSRAVGLLKKEGLIYTEKDSSLHLTEEGQKKAEKIYVLSESPEVSIGEKTQVEMQVTESGIYNVIIKMMSPMTNLSQSSTNALINGERFTTIQTCGTDGNWITEKMMRVSLQEGYYTLKLEVAKPGIEIEYLAFESV